MTGKKEWKEAYGVAHATLYLMDGISNIKAIGGSIDSDIMLRSVESARRLNYARKTLIETYREPTKTEGADEVHRNMLQYLHQIMNSKVFPLLEVEEKLDKPDEKLGCGRGMMPPYRTLQIIREYTEESLYDVLQNLGRKLTEEVNNLGRKVCDYPLDEMLTELYSKEENLLDKMIVDKIFVVSQDISSEKGDEK